MEPTEENGEGVFTSLRRMVKTVVSIAHNRLELLLVEMEEERWRFFDALLLAGLTVILAGMTLTVVTVTIVVLCVRADRLDLLLVLILVYLAATVVGFWRLHSRLKGWTPFSATLAELRKDKACWEEKS